MKKFLLFLGVFIFTNSFAYVPTLKEECLAIQSSICRMNNIEFHINTVCPKDAVTVKPLGEESCEDEKLQKKIINDVYQKKQNKNNLPIVSSLEVNEKEAINKNSILFFGFIFGLMILSFVSIFLIKKAIQNNPKNFKFNFSYISLSIFLDCLVTKVVVENVFKKYNHDSIAPLFIAIGYAIITFIVVGLIFAILFWVISKILKERGSEKA